VHIAADRRTNRGLWTVVEGRDLKSYEVYNLDGRPSIAFHTKHMDYYYFGVRNRNENCLILATLVPPMQRFIQVLRCGSRIGIGIEMIGSGLFL
jgi:hypothetical protein